MTKESFIKKWLGNPDKKYTPEFKDEMRDDLDKLSQSQQIDIQTLNTGQVKKMTEEEIERWLDVIADKANPHDLVETLQLFQLRLLRKE